MSHGKKSESWRGSLRNFLEGDLAEKAGSHLREGAALRLYIDDQHFLYRRHQGKNTLHENGPGNVDATFWLSSDTLQQLLKTAALPGTGLGSMGVAVFERIFHSEPQHRLRFHLDTGLFGLWRGGYFSVLKAGGPEVASYLARLGHGGVSWIKDILRKI